MRCLFVCAENVDRSKTGARVCKEIIKEKCLDIEVESAGLDIPSSGAGRQLTKQIADSADKIFVMEQYLVGEVVGTYLQKKEKIECLNIRDDYDTSHPQEKKNLEEIFRKKLEYWIEIGSGQC